MQLHKYFLIKSDLSEVNSRYYRHRTSLKVNYTSQTALLTTFLLTEVIEVTEDGSGSRYGKSQSIFLIMCIHQRKTAELCNYFLFFRIYWCLLSIQSLAIKPLLAFLMDFVK